MTSTPRNPEDIPALDEQPDTLSSDAVESTEVDVATVQPAPITSETPVIVTAPVDASHRLDASGPVDESAKVTRAGMVWTATVAGLIMLVLLIIFIVQNPDQVTLRYFGLSGQVSLGIGLLIAAVAGGLLAAMAGAVRIIQLRALARKNRKNNY